jgi:hypothetical protein
MHRPPLLRIRRKAKPTVSIAFELDLVCIVANKPFIPNYGDRYRNGETISTAFVESAVNQVERHAKRGQALKYPHE